MSHDQKTTDQLKVRDLSVLKPLLAVKADISKLKYPVVVSPKIDGIRCLMVDGVAMSRTMKPIPNKFVQEHLKGMHGEDGELVVVGEDFNGTSSGIMSVEGEPDFRYMVFDYFDSDKGYTDRVPLCDTLLGKVFQLPYATLHCEERVLKMFDIFTRMGYEGAMLRDPDGKYKHGRSTVKEGILLKLKKFEDNEGVLVKIVEKMHNTNPAKKDVLGHTERSSAKEGKVPSGTAGACILQLPDGREFKVGFGPGFTDEVKQQMWDDREELTGKTYKYSYQEKSSKGIPRFGKLLGERHEEDMGN